MASHHASMFIVSDWAVRVTADEQCAQAWRSTTVRLTIDDQDSAVVRSCNYNIRQLRAVRSTLSRDALRDSTICPGVYLVSFTASIYMPLLQPQIQRLQMLINMASCVVSERRVSIQLQIPSNTSFIGYLLLNVYNLRYTQWLSRLFNQSPSYI